MEAKTDRRIQRTRQLLEDALLALIVEKGYTAITVQDVLNRANLGRSTFYAHYRDKDDLLESVFERFKKVLAPADVRLPPEGHGLSSREPSPSLAFFRHAGEQHRLYQAMVGKQGGETVRKLLYQYITTLMKSHLEQTVPDDEKMPVPREVAVHYFVSSYLALLTWWLDNDMPYSVERMDEMFTMLTQPGLSLALGGRG